MHWLPTMAGCLAHQRGILHRAVLIETLSAPAVEQPPHVLDLAHPAAPRSAE
jgi:hypothetical protein